MSDEIDLGGKQSGTTNPEEPDATPSEDADTNPGGSTPSLTLADSALTFGLLHFQYRYPSGFDRVDQQAIEEVRSRANRNLANKTIASYDELSTAKSEWLLEMGFGTAPVFGRV